MRSLPTEVLYRILQAVKVSTIEGPDLSLSACLRVCSLWHDVGIKVLYIDVALNKSTLPSFTESHQSAELATTRSLTIQIKPESTPEAGTSRTTVPKSRLAADGSSAETRALWASLPRLASKISHMANLETFSFSVTAGGTSFRDEYDGFWLRDSDIDDLITSLPPTVRHVEIDTKGFNRSTFPAVHLCPKLRARMPYLQTLRLRLASLCPSILDLAAWDPNHTASSSDQASGHKSLVINTAGAHMPTTLCKDTKKIAACTSHSLRHSRQLDSTRRLIASLVSQSEKILSSEDFRPLARLSIITTACSNGDADLTAIVDRNLVKLKTTCNPYYISRHDTALHFIDAQGEDAQVIGDFFEVEAFAEGHEWLMTVDGLRFPASFKESRRCREGIYRWRTPQVQMDWWHYDDLAGHKFFCAIVIDGVGDVDIPLEEHIQQELDDESYAAATAEMSSADDLWAEFGLAHA